MSELKDAIVAALKKIFASQCRYYVEEIPQGFQAPCFFIYCISTSQKPYLKDRYFQTCSFDIHYFPRRGKTEIHDVEAKLYDCLEYITVGNYLVRGTGMHSEIVDGVLHFFVQYNEFLVKSTLPEEYMREVRVNGRTRK